LGEKVAVDLAFLLQALEGHLEPEKLVVLVDALGQVRYERDEAAAAARTFLKELKAEWEHRASPWALVEEWEARWPWLKEGD